MQTPDYWENLVKRSVTRFLVMGALFQRPMHGYGISQYLKECCSGCCDPSYATIYPTLQELLDEGYIQCVEERQGRRVRKVCHLTQKGRDAYRTGAQVWKGVLPDLARFIGQAAETAGEKRLHSPFGAGED